MHGVRACIRSTRYPFGFPNFSLRYDLNLMALPVETQDVVRRGECDAKPHRGWWMAVRLLLRRRGRGRCLPFG